MGWKHLQIDTAKRIATIALDRPPVNAVDRDFFRDIREAFVEIGADREVSVIVFTSVVDRAFCGGADIKALAPVRRLIDPGAAAREAFWAVLDCPVPVIAAVNGPALGAGLAFAACCDLLVASERAVFGCPEIDIGVLGGYAHLERMVGRYKARELYLTAARVPAVEFAAMNGAVAQVVPHDELTDAARALATSIAARSPAAVRLAKEAIARVDGLPLKEAYRVEQDYTNRLRHFDDSTEARRTFQERRPPNFTGD